MDFKVVTRAEHDALLFERVLERSRERQLKIAEEQKWLWGRKKLERDLAPGEDVYPYG